MKKLLRLERLYDVNMLGVIRSYVTRAMLGYHANTPSRSRRWSNLKFRLRSLRKRNRSSHKLPQDPINTGASVVGSSGGSEGAGGGAGVQVVQAEGLPQSIDK
jgi:uncharacterized membrane protein YgcG